jgi:predicted transcriptional regulator of viral defense system
MKHRDFIQEFRSYPLMKSTDIESVFKEPIQHIRNQLTSWTKKGILIQLKRGMYLLNDDDRKREVSRYVVANALCEPSYVSLESALQFYGLIPEKVVELTSITTKKTQSYETHFGRYRFQHVKCEAFNGFVSVKDENAFSFFIAEPEKALLDYLYLNDTCTTAEVFIESLRLQNAEELDLKKIHEYALRFNNTTLMKLSDGLCGLLNKKVHYRRKHA